MLDNLTDWIIFIAVVLILFGGANKIPELARGLGRAVGEFRKAQIEMEREISNMNKTNQTPPTQNQTVASQTPQSKTGASKADIEKRISELESEINRLKQMLENT